MVPLPPHSLAVIQVELASLFLETCRVVKGAERGLLSMWAPRRSSLLLPGMLKAWRAHQAEVRRREEAGEPPFKTIEDFRVEIPDALRDAPEPEPKAADSTESEVPKGVREVSDAQTVGETGVQSEAGVGGDRSAKVPRVK